MKNCWDRNILRHYLKQYFQSPVWLFVAIIVTEASLFWPGILRSDSIGQMNLAQSLSPLSGSDHHPPIMAILWYYIAKIIPGSGGMLLLHECLFWSAIYYLYQSLSTKAGRIVLLCACFLPQIFVLRLFVLKDISFSVCFLLVVSLIVHAVIHRRQLTCIKLMIISTLLFYGSAVKYQAVFLAPMVIWWVIKAASGHQSVFKTAFCTVLSSGCLLMAVNTLNNYTAKPSYAWQYVKLYDLAGISVREHKILFPHFAVNNNHFSFEHLQQLYSPLRVDEMVFAEHPILKTANNSEQRQQLQAYWWSTVMHHPWSYLQHRGAVLKMQLMLSPVKAPSLIKSAVNDNPTLFIKIGLWLEQHHLIKILQIATSLAPYLILSLAYVIYASRNRDGISESLLLMNFTSLALMAILFILSMAAEVRYIYLSTCLIHLSHAFAVQAYQQSRIRHGKLNY